MLIEISEKYGGNPNEDLSKKINYVFAYSVIWGLGASFS